LYDANTFNRFWPKIPFIIGAAPFPGDAERLAGESGGKDVNHSRIRSGVSLIEEFSDIAKERSVIENSICNPLFDDLLAEFITLNISNRLPSK
jgi:hypothetical protein